MAHSFRDSVARWQQRSEGNGTCKACRRAISVHQVGGRFLPRRREATARAEEDEGVRPICREGVEMRADFGHDHCGDADDPLSSP